MPVMRRGALVVALAALTAPLLVAAPSVAAPAATGAPVTVSVVVPVTAPIGDGLLLDAAALEAATSPSGVLTRELDEVLATSATIALDPRILASIRALGTSAPDSAVEWLTRLETAPNEVFLLAYAGADPTSLVRAESLDLADDLDLDFAIDPGNFGPAPTPTPTATETPDPTESATPDPTETPADDAPPPLPTSEDLLAWPEAIGRIAWPATGSARGGDLAAYVDAGYDGVLLNSANVSETSDARADISGIRALIADSAASDLFQQASTSVDDATRDQVLGRLHVALDGLAAAHPGRSVVLTLSRSSSFSFYGLAEAYAALVQREGTQLSGLSGVLARPGDGALVVDGPDSPATQRTPDLVAALDAERRFASILDDPLLLTSPRRLELLALLAVPELDVAEWPSRADEFLARSAEILASVSIVDTGDFFVASSSTSIPIHVANALEFPVTVRLDVRPLRPRISIDSPVEVTIEPGSSKAVRLDAQAITNGDVVIVVSLTSPTTGVAIGQTRTFNVDLQAQWETVGFIVGGVVVLVFAAGIVRNVVLRRRRGPDEADADEPAREGA